MYLTTRLVENRPLGRGNFVLRLALPDAHADALQGALPGTFVMLRGEWGRDPLLPRAFSILRLTDGGCEILVKAIGRGTRLLQLAAEGAPLGLLGPLGRAFTPGGTGHGDYLVAGGVGLAPLLWYAEQYRDGHHLLYGARTADDLVLLDEIAKSGAQVTLTTEDGSAPRGHEVLRGRVTDAMKQLLPKKALSGTPRVLTCGPNAMMRAVVELARASSLQCLVSVEGEMACGIGACLGCALPLLDGTKPFAYACTDGPVFDANRVVIP
jgi:dihydroorotate dehydrogenase electron transfer subunit